jgi:prevent-host-death family protein
VARIPHIVPVTDFRQDAAAVLKRVQESTGPVVVTQRGRAAAVMLSVSLYEKQAEALEIMRRLVLGEREIAAGAGHSLESVLADVDALLADDDS